MDASYAAVFANALYILLQTKLFLISLLGLIVLLFAYKLWEKLYGVDAACSCNYKRNERVG